MRAGFRAQPLAQEAMSGSAPNVRAATVSPREARRRMHSMRRRVREYDVAHWAAAFLNALNQVPEQGQPPAPLPPDQARHESEQEERRPAALTES